MSKAITEFDHCQQALNDYILWGPGSHFTCSRPKLGRLLVNSPQNSEVKGR